MPAEHFTLATTVADNQGEAKEPPPVGTYFLLVGGYFGRYFATYFICSGGTSTPTPKPTLGATLGFLAALLL
eukprot:4299684-Pyramimonas_sp.AAC.1